MAGVDNWMYLAYLAGYCAAQGRTIVTKENYLECIVAVSYWQKDPQSSLLMQYKHVPEVITKLAETGYSRKFYRSMMVKAIKDTNLKVFLGALRRWPAFAIQTLGLFLSFVSQAMWEMHLHALYHIPSSQLSQTFHRVDQRVILRDNPFHTLHIQANSPWLHSQ